MSDFEYTQNIPSYPPVCGSNMPSFSSVLLLIQQPLSGVHLDLSVDIHRNRLKYVNINKWLICEIFNSTIIVQICIYVNREITIRNVNFVFHNDLGKI